MKEEITINPPKFEVGDKVRYRNEVFEIKRVQSPQTPMYPFYTYLISSTTNSFATVIMEDQIKYCLSRKQTYYGQ